VTPEKPLTLQFRLLVADAAAAAKEDWAARYAAWTATLAR
jgi:hypothetical protein